MWSSTLSPIFGRHFWYSSSSGVVQAASSLMMTELFILYGPTSRSFVVSQIVSASPAELIQPWNMYL